MFLISVSATAIPKKLIEAEPSSNSEVYWHGFEVVFEQMREGRGFLETVVARLGCADTGMPQYRYVSYHSTPLVLPTFLVSMNLINAMLTHVINDPRWEEFIHELERLNVRKAVIVRVRLMTLATPY